jgi:hypothetical protein
MFLQKSESQKAQKEKCHSPATLNAGDSNDDVEIQELILTEERIEPKRIDLDSNGKL